MVPALPANGTRLHDECGADLKYIAGLFGPLCPPAVLATLAVRIDDAAERVGLRVEDVKAAAAFLALRLDRVGSQWDLLKEFSACLKVALDRRRVREETEATRRGLEAAPPVAALLVGKMAASLFTKPEDFDRGDESETQTGRRQKGRGQAQPKAEGEGG